MKFNWYLYIVRTQDGSLYTGITTDINRRLTEHQSNSKKSAKYLRGKGQLELVYQYQLKDRSMASKLELKVKKLSKRKKEDLITGKIDFSNLLDNID